MVSREEIFLEWEILCCFTLIGLIHGHSPLQIDIAREVQRAHSYMHPVLGYVSMKMTGQSKAGVGIVF